MVARPRDLQMIRAYIVEGKHDVLDVVQALDRLTEHVAKLEAAVLTKEAS